MLTQWILNLTVNLIYCPALIAIYIHKIKSKSMVYSFREENGYD